MNRYILIEHNFKDRAKPYYSYFDTIDTSLSSWCNIGDDPTKLHYSIYRSAEDIVGVFKESNAKLTNSYQDITDGIEFLETYFPELLL